LIGFTYGIWPGFLIAVIAAQIGAGIAFLSVRVSILDHQFVDLFTEEGFGDAGFLPQLYA
jgi:uncharacterized membrane protein YdjX (TVP38/TMEM64 family)